MAINRANDNFCFSSFSIFIKKKWRKDLWAVKFSFGSGLNVHWFVLLVLLSTRWKLSKIKSNHSEKSNSTPLLHTPHKRYETRYPLKCYSLCLQPSGKSAYRWCTCSCLHIKLGYKKITRHRHNYMKQLYNQSSLERSTFALWVNTQKNCSFDLWLLSASVEYVVKWKNFKSNHWSAGKSLALFWSDDSSFSTRR